MKSAEDEEVPPPYATSPLPTSPNVSRPTTPLKLNAATARREEWT